MPIRYGKIFLTLCFVAVIAGSAVAQYEGPGSYSGYSVPTGEPFWTDRYRQEIRRSREDAIARYNYCPTSGCVVRLESVDLKPKKVMRGQGIKLTTTYTLLTASDVAIPVRFSREIIFRGQPLGKTLSGSTRNSNGTWSQETNFVLPAEVPAGTYLLRTKITTAFGSDEKTVPFTVE